MAVCHGEAHDVWVPARRQLPPTPPPLSGPAGGASRFHQGAVLSASSPPSAPPELYSAHSSRRRAPPATHHRHTRSRHNVGSAETRPGHFAQSQTLPLTDLWSSVETEVGCRCGSGALTPGREE
ncbi:unnamed protein product [Arctogadus glacialis]